MKTLIAHQRLSTVPWDFIAAHGLSYSEKALRLFIPKQNIQWTGSARAGISQLLSPGEKVGLPAFTCHVVHDAIIHAGAIPIFIDAGAIVTVGDIEKHIKKIETLLIPYNFGFMSSMEKIKALCKKYNVRIIEDCAQALGATADNKMAGSFGDAAVYSFGISKNIGLIGGIVATETPFLYQGTNYPLVLRYKEYIKAMIQGAFFHPLVYQWTKKFLPQDQTTTIKNYILPDYAKYVLLAQARRYPTILAQRRSNAAYLLQELAGYVDMIKPEPGTNPAWLYFVFLHNNRDALRTRLLHEGIDVQPLHTFCDVSKTGEKAMLMEKNHLAFALLRPRHEIEMIVQIIKRVVRNG